MLVHARGIRRCARRLDFGMTRGNGEWLESPVVLHADGDVNAGDLVLLVETIGGE